jgi:hypothetical protein
MLNSKVFFVSDKVNWYLPPALEQAVQMLGPERVVFICDQPHKFSGQTILASDLEARGVNEFARVYEHLSSNPYGFEFACFRRWFLIAAACEKLGCDVAVHLDTDIGLGAGFDMAFLAQLSQFPFAACSIRDDSYCVSPHVSVFHREELTRFCDFLIESYRDAAQLAALRRFREAEELGAGGICDMILLRLFANRRPMVNLLDGDGPTIDENINRGLNRFGEPSFVTNAWGFKKIRRSGGRFYGRRADGSERELAALHFQGFAKLLLPAMLGRPGVYLSTSKRLLFAWAWQIYLQRRRAAGHG